MYYSYMYADNVRSILQYIKSKFAIRAVNYRLTVHPTATTWSNKQLTKFPANWNRYEAAASIPIYSVRSFFRSIGMIRDIRRIDGSDSHSLSLCIAGALHPKCLSLSLPPSLLPLSRSFLLLSFLVSPVRSSFNEAGRGSIPVRHVNVNVNVEQDPARVSQPRVEGTSTN